MKYRKKFIFAAVLIVVFLALDLLTEHFMQPYFLSSGRFSLSDFEIVQRDHPEETWDKVFFGNSVVVSGFREEESGSGYINLGMVYGVVTDLWEIIDKDLMQVGSEIVIGLNALTLYDDFDTNPYYPWHRKWYEPYCYFERDRLKTLLEESFGQLTGLSSEPISYAYLGQHKYYSYGVMSSQEIYEYRHNGHYKQYLTLKEEDYRDNFRAMEKVYNYCRENGIRLRLVWMPSNPIVELDEATACAYGLAKDFAERHQVEFYDMTGMLDTECFYDGGHFNYEYGAHVFTEVIDSWLAEKES